ncbi:MAG: PLDc N-terminal domain-containing protein, partial [Eubacterium sp.]|nr:PLDc N-terminal domain-containing protein [Eubacterium sp.]
MEVREKLKKRKYLAGLKGRVQNSLSGFFRACIVAILVVFQFAIILLLPYFLRQYSSYMYLAIEILGVLTILALTNDSRSISYKFAWLCIIVVLPISGNIMFMLWGKVGKRNKLNQRIKKQIQEVDTHLVQNKELVEQFAGEHPVSSRMSRYMQAEGAPLYTNNNVTYYDFGESAFEDMFADLEKA